MTVCSLQHSPRTVARVVLSLVPLVTPVSRVSSCILSSAQVRVVGARHLPIDRSSRRPKLHVTASIHSGEGRRVSSLSEIAARPSAALAARQKMTLASPTLRWYRRRAGCDPNEAKWPDVVSKEGALEFVVDRPDNGRELRCTVMIKRRIAMNFSPLSQGVVGVSYDSPGAWTGPMWYDLASGGGATRSRSLTATHLPQLCLNICVRALDASSRNSIVGGMGQGERLLKRLNSDRRMRMSDRAISSPILGQERRGKGGKGGRMSLAEAMAAETEARGKGSTEVGESAHTRNSSNGGLRRQAQSDDYSVEARFFNNRSSPTGARRGSADATTSTGGKSSGGGGDRGGGDGGESKENRVMAVLPAIDSVSIIYKDGDDLRQDHFVCQMVSVVDSLLKDAGLDLKLLQYRVMATGPRQGLIEYVPGTQALSAVLSKYGSLLSFWQESNYDASGKYNVKDKVVNNFLRSCAGYR